MICCLLCSFRYVSVLVELAQLNESKNGELLANQLLDVAVRVASVRPFAVSQMVSQRDLAVAYFAYQYLLCACGCIRPGRVVPASPRHGDESWVGSTPMSPVPASLHLLALQLKPSLSGLCAPERPLFTPPLFLV